MRSAAARVDQPEGRMQCREVPWSCSARGSVSFGAFVTDCIVNCQWICSLIPRDIDLSFRDRLADVGTCAERHAHQLRRGCELGRTKSPPVVEGVRLAAA